MHAADYREKTPLLAFLQQAQDLIAQIGVPASWEIVQCRPVAAGTLGLGVDVQGSSGARPTIMVFRKQGETWVLANSQYRMPVPAEPPPAARPFRTDLKPDLKPALSGAEPAPAQAPAAARPAPAQPDAPIGPDAP